MGDTYSPRGPRAAQQLLERSSQLTELARQLETIERTGSGRAVLVSGEAGVGKTTLVRAFRATEEKHTRFLWGACDPLFTPRPLGAVHDIAEQAEGELLDLVTGAGKPFTVATSLLRALAQRPTVLVLEDLHWADEASLDVLGLVVRRLETVPALVVATYRDEDIGDHAFRATLGELVRQPRVGRLRLDGLSQSAVAVLAAPHGVDADELYRATAGNAFFVTEVLAAGDETIPSTVRDAVLARVARVSPQARGLLEAIAIGSAATELWVLERIAPDLLPALDECLAAGMVRDDDAGIAFRHELARLAIEATLSRHRRLVLHRAALTALEQPPRGPPDLARLAHHAEAAQDAAAVLHYAPAAAERAAAVGAHRQAAAQYARALRFADDLPLPERAALLGRAAREHTFVGRMTEAVALRRQAVRTYRAAGDRVGEGIAVRSLPWPLWVLGRRDEAEQSAREAIAVLEDCSAEAELARAYAAVSFLCATANDLDGAIAAGTRTLELAERTGDSRAAVQALMNMAGLKYLFGDPCGRTELERCLDMVRQADQPDEIASAYNWLAHGAVRSRDHHSATRVIEAGLDVCHRYDLDGFSPMLVALRGEQELQQGDWDAAAASATVVLDAQGAGPATVWAMATLGRLRARRGDPGHRALLDRALELAEPSREFPRLAPVGVARCEAAWLEGRDGDALHETDAAWAMCPRAGDAWLVGELAHWRRRAGAHEDPPIALAEPYALALAGDWRRASALWAELGCPYDAALVAAEGDDDDVRRQALQQLQRMGARATAAVVARRLRERGARGLPRGPRPQTTRNPAQLTAREMEIAALVAEGLRNADIAERLFISPRTADHHVSAILRKLDVTSRAQVAAAASRLGVIPK